MLNWDDPVAKPAVTETNLHVPIPVNARYRLRL